MAAKCTLRDIFQAGFKDYLRTHWLPFYLLKAGYAILQCRTAALGGHVKLCPEGHVEKAWYNSCRHRACPLCAWIKIDEWLEKVRARLLPTDHYHVTFTLPDELRVFWHYNQKLIGDLVFKVAGKTLFKVLADPKHMGAKPGILMSLHTWSRSLWAHVHIHCLVTGGGVTADGRWQPCRREGFLAPDDQLAYWFRDRFVKTLRRLLEKGQVELPQEMNRFQAKCLISQAESKDWIVDVEKPYPHGEGVATYLARYVRGGPLKNSRLLSRDDETVTFRVSRKDEPWKEMRLSISELIRRILMHVPPIGYRVVRSFGLYHHHYREQLEACRQKLGGGGIPESADTAAEVDREEPPEDDWLRVEEYCRICGCLLEVEAIPRAPPPPELARYMESRR